MTKDLALSLLGELFAPAAKSFDNNLNCTLIEAVKKDMDVVKFSLSGEISLNKAYVPDEDVTEYHADREVVSPSVKYKTDFSIQTKNGSAGTLPVPKGCELYYDAESDRMKARVPDSGQTSLFDEPDKGVSYSVGEGGVVTDVEFGGTPVPEDEDSQDEQPELVDGGYPDYGATAGEYPDESADDGSDPEGTDDAGDD